MNPLKLKQLQKSQKVTEQGASASNKTGAMEKYGSSSWLTVLEDTWDESDDVGDSGSSSDSSSESDERM